MSAVHATININAPASKVFDAVTDLHSYSKWLPESASFKGTTEISEAPVRLGTTYVERGPVGVRNGRVIEFDRPWKVVFEQPLQMDASLGGFVIGIRVEVTLREEGEGVTALDRDVYVSIPEQLSAHQEALEEGARDEAERVVGFLKTYVESLP